MLNVRFKREIYISNYIFYISQCVIDNFYKKYHWKVILKQGHISFTNIDEPVTFSAF